MKIFNWKKSNIQKIAPQDNSTSGSFRDLSSVEKEKFLKKSAQRFSKDFTKVIVKLANE
ncbi:MAG: hypothetical protein WC059_01720 [Candidatus Paceibacterota bacterium]